MGGAELTSRLVAVWREGTAGGGEIAAGWRSLSVCVVGPTLRRSNSKCNGTRMSSGAMFSQMSVSDRSEQCGAVRVERSAAGLFPFCGAGPPRPFSSADFQKKNKVRGEGKEAKIQHKTPLQHNQIQMVNSCVLSAMKMDGRWPWRR